MALSLTPRHFVTKMVEKVKRVDDRLDDYIKDSNENSIHDIRTATRRLDASYMSLPKKIRRKTKIRKYVTTSKQLFKVNSQVRDCDIICEKLQKYSSEPIYSKLIGSLNRKRKTKLASARKIALSLRELPVPRVTENEIHAKQVEKRFNKVVLRLRQRIQLDLPIVVTNASKIEELHELRKTCKKLRYLLELVSHQNGINNKEIHTLITELEDVQDILGSIHDSDMMIFYLRRLRHQNEVTNILHDEISERDKKYEDFVQFCKRSLSDTRHNFLNQITLLI
ncbi:MAG TPA: CHAD domain-containing protein [Candidatus Bathyarchaeia archaeon]|nr:CHAD domain-containing protein [Candidatus Bathyarchaeia archaeon]